MAATPRVRLDVVVTERGLTASRERARALILAGRVRVDGAVVSKVGTMIAAGALVSLDEPDFPWVGRGGVKLAHALDAFAVAVTGREALDIGASTGGFTDVLLQRGATRVVALDVGHGQLDWRLRSDARVIALEHRNARDLDLGWLPGPVDVVTIDVSFISLRLILPAVPGVMHRDADLVALVKPQFGAGRDEVGPGVGARSGRSRCRARPRVGGRSRVRPSARGDDTVAHYGRHRQSGAFLHLRRDHHDQACGYRGQAGADRGGVQLERHRTVAASPGVEPVFESATAEMAAPLATCRCRVTICLATSNSCSCLAAMARCWAWPIASRKPAWRFRFWE